MALTKVASGVESIQTLTIADGLTLSDGACYTSKWTWY